jgi:DNA invertase Pin-like site-specific DNA recombinase
LIDYYRSIYNLLIETGSVNMATIGYARVSTTDQNLDAQLAQLHAAGCDRVYQEKESGAKADRPELTSMLDYARQGDTVVVCKLDRIARSTKHLLDIVDTLQDKGVTFKALNIDLDTSTATGKLMLTMLGAIATFEREKMLERQLEGIAQAKAAGVYKGRKPTAREKTADVIKLLGEGLTKEATAERLGIGVASVYRIAKDARATSSLPTSI